MADPNPSQAPGPGDAPVVGVCHVLFAYDIGLTVDLASAARTIRESAPRQAIRQRRRAPAWFDYEPAPLRVTQQGASIAVGGSSTDPMVDCTIYDFGAVSVGYRIPLDADISALPAMSADLYENVALLADSRRRVEAIVGALGGAVSKPAISALVEDYHVFALQRWPDGRRPGELLGAHGHALARALEAETEGLSAQLVRDTLASRISYTPDDLALVSWNGAVVFDSSPDDVLAVLEHANVELLEMRHLDARLDEVLDHAYGLLAKQTTWTIWPLASGAAQLHRLAALQADSSLMFEGVNNAIKLLGDQYLARLYRLAAERMDLPAWDASVLRKLESADSIYQKIEGFQSTRRLEILEVVIVLLILISIVIPFLPWNPYK